MRLAAHRERQALCMRPCALGDTRVVRGSFSVSLVELISWLDGSEEKKHFFAECMNGE